MAAIPIDVVSTLRAVQYDGTNSGDITALDEFDFNNSSESGGVWSFQSPPDATSYTINTGDWILYAQNMVMLKNSNSEFILQYSCNTLCADVGGFSSGQQVRAMGFAPVPSLVLNATANIDVTLSPAMPDDTYTAHASKFAGVSVTDLNITSVTVVDEDTVTVGVQNVGLLTLAGATIAVHAVA